MTGALSNRASSSASAAVASVETKKRGHAVIIPLHRQQVYTPVYRSTQHDRDQAAAGNMKQQSEAERTDHRHDNLQKDFTRHTAPPPSLHEHKRAACRDGKRSQNRFKCTEQSGDGVAHENIAHGVDERNARNQQHDVADNDIIQILSHAGFLP